MVAWVDQGFTLQANKEGDVYAVWVDYGTKTSSSAYEDVTQEELDAVIAACPGKVDVHTPPWG